MASYENVMPLNTHHSIMLGRIVQIGSVQLTLLTPERPPSEDRGLYLGFYGAGDGNRTRVVSLEG